MKKGNIYVVFGMLFLIIAILVNRYSNISDFSSGILYGITIAILIFGIFNNRKKQ